MRIRRPTPGYLPLLLPLLCLSATGCVRAEATGGRPSAGGDDIPALPEGQVRLRPESMRFLSMEQVGDAPEAPKVVAPAAVTFRDGAVASLGAPVAGRVTQVHVGLGEQVQKGAVLLTLASPEAAAARAELERAKSVERLAREAAARHARLVEKGVGLEVEHLAAKAHLREAEAELDRAQRAASFLGDGRGETVHVRAPLSGTVLSRRVDVGATVTPGEEPLAVVGDPSALRVVAEVFERDLSLIAVGAEAWVEVSARTGPVRAKVTAVGAAVDSTLRRAPVFLELLDGEALHPGGWARASIQAVAGSGAVLPASAVLVKDAKTHVVFVHREANLFERRPVTVGRSVGGTVQVLAGLSPGEQVVVKGALLLDGAADQLL